ncbi:MAG: GNAT family N-acetyltransferase [Asgard group archaeon]|nr:GNAT family N-acetyltransferase [Asgard group archaeon]
MGNHWREKITIRLPKIIEAQDIAQLIVQAYSPIKPILGRKPRGMLETKENIEQRILEKNIFILEYENKVIIGTFTIKPNKKENLMELQKVAVRPTLQNKGIGSYIVECAEKKVKEEMNKKKLMVETYQDHKQLVDFYKHRGYEITGERWSKGNIVLKMVKNLSGD